MDFPDLIDPSDLGIHFFYEEVSFDLIEETISNWLNTVVETEDKVLRSIRFIFCKDAYLHQINVDYLNHDTLTDVITFPYATEEAVVDGEIFISVERIAENAKTFKITFEQELNRVMVHGVLHLCGYDDKGKKAKEKMTEKEDYYLNKLK